MKPVMSLLAVFTLLLLARSAPAQMLSGAALVQALRHGGYVLVVRHASSPREAPDKQTANADNVNQERQLDQIGRTTAIAMGKALNIRVIAEGVETQEQLNFLKEYGCYEFQGYLFSSPLEANALTEMIHTASPGAYTHRYARTIQAVSTSDH